MHVPIKVDYGVRALVDLAIYGSDGNSLRSSDSYDADLLGDLEILQGISRYPARIKCATLAWHTLHSAIHDENEVVSTE
jgi:NifU-like protein involved in Fe-S cluster formation